VTAGHAGLRGAHAPVLLRRDHGRVRSGRRPLHGPVGAPLRRARRLLRGPDLFGRPSGRSQHPLRHDLRPLPSLPRSHAVPVICSQRCPVQMNETDGPQLGECDTKTSVTSGACDTP
jgi:hypothetical protein